MLKTYYFKFYTNDNQVSAKEIQAYTYFDAKCILEKTVSNIKCIINWNIKN